ncbi:MAG: WYL domain-containing protein [Arachnia sp.]
MRSDTQLARLLRLVPYLSAHPGVAVSEVAEAFGVSDNQVIRDLEVLQFCGLPGGLWDDLFDIDLEAIREDGVIELRNADVLRRPLRLRPAEASSLIAALRLVVESAGVSDAATSALAKLERAVGDVDPGLSVTVAPSDPGHRDALTTAIAERRVVRLGYTAAGRAEVSTALVEPARLRLVDGYTYLDAWSLTRDAWRSYRLDRIVSVEPLEDRFNERDDPPSAWFEDVPDRLTLTVRPAARWIAEYFPTSAVADLGDRLEVTFPYASPRWAAALLLRLGDDVLEVSDETVREAARALAREALSGYVG